jgi:excinuclease ABC subunit C
MNSSNLKNKIAKFPNSPGVYIFYGENKEILYIGKATSLRDRVGQYFNGTDERGERILKMVEKSTDVKIIKTDSVLEALILESNLIKKHQPKYNIERKDDKSFSYVVITREDFPRIFILRKTEVDQMTNDKFPISNKFPISKFSNKLKIKNSKLKIEPSRVYGPYTSKKQLEIALKILRRIFPYHSKKENSEKGCLEYQLGLCPGPYASAISKEDYQKNIRGIQMILEGKKKNLLQKMKKEMEVFSKKQEFEKAGEIRNKIFALKHIQDVALITSNTRDENFQPASPAGGFSISNFGIDSKFKIQNSKFRIEGYDISNISGKFAVGSMVVFDNTEGELSANKNEYRKFKIKTIFDANDVGMMEEVIRQRFQNNWPEPNLILLDGGVGHLNVARKILRNYKLEIPILAVAKGPTRKKLDLRSFGTVSKISQNLISQIRDEAHRFAISYHRKLRDKKLING